MNEHIFKELNLGRFMVKHKYMTEQEYFDNLVDYNLLIVDYSLKLGIQSFQQSIVYYVSEIKRKNIKVEDKIKYLSKCLESTYHMRIAGIY